MTTKTSTKGMEYVRCNLCGADDTTVCFQISVREDQRGVYAQDIWDIVQCQKCSLIYTNPRPDPNALLTYYTFTNKWDYQFIQDWFVENADLQRPTWQRFLRTMRRFVPSGKLLDVGCGAGSFLLEAKKAGYDVCGQEIAPYFVDYCRNEHNLQIFEGTLTNLDLGNDSFDVVTAFDVIEHHPDPKTLLSEMFHLLKPNGIVTLSTHDIGNFYARRYGARWRYLNPIGHLTYFTRQTLTSMLQETGFHILKVGGIHTIDDSRISETRRRLPQFCRVILLRALIIGLYRPVTNYWPQLTRWQITMSNTTLNHKKLMMRAGNQVVMDDDMVIVARAGK